MKTTTRIALFCTALLAPGLALAQNAVPPPTAPSAPAAGATASGESADALLARIDKQATSFKDAIFHFKMRIKDANVREIEFKTWQKGTQKRLVRFLAPGDIAGMGILVENPTTMYALLPAFGNRVRRLGAHQMNQSFMGSDLSSDDMSQIELVPFYAPKAVGVEGTQTILELNARPGKPVQTPRIKMWVETVTAQVTKLEYYDASGKKLRTQERSDYKKDGATHYSPGKMVFTDHVRNNHQTELILLDSETDKGLSDDMFKQSALAKD